MTILIACGLQREARIFSAPGYDAIAGGGDADRLEATLDARAPGSAGILSCGLAGALDPALRVGDVVVSGRITDGEPTDDGHGARCVPDWAGAVHAALEAAEGPIFANGRAIGSRAEKAALFAATGAVAVDMESHIAARVADRHGLPFLAIRVISDGAADALPPAALVGMNPDGSMALGRVLASLARHPLQLPALIRTGMAAETAFAGLRRVHHALVGVGIGRANLGQFTLDVA